MLYATNRFPGDGTTTQYEFTFVGGYISTSHVKVYTEDADTLVRTPVTITGANFLNPTTLKSLPPTPVGKNLVIHRVTPKPPLVDFVNGSRITEANLDLVARQGLFVAMEAMDLSDPGATQALLDASALVMAQVPGVTAAAASAALAAGDAVTAKDAAQLAASSAATALATTIAARDAASASAASANASKNAAATSATQSANSSATANTAKDSAVNAATTAVTQATTATTQAGIAITKASESAASADAAALSAGDAAIAKNAAQTAATSAATALTNTTAAKDAAAASATAANTSKNAAATSASNAAGSATTAATQAGNANTSATNASASAGAASTSAGQASTSASGAATSASNANVYAGQAASFASTAQMAQTAALASAVDAAQSATLSLSNANATAPFHCILSSAGGTAVGLYPWGGRSMVIGGTVRLLPEGGVTTTLPNTAALQHIYAYWSGGTIGLTYSSTAPSWSAVTGMWTLPANNDYCYVGSARGDHAGRYTHLRSFYNGAGAALSSTLAADIIGNWNGTTRALLTAPCILLPGDVWTASCTMPIINEPPERVGDARLLVDATQLDTSRASHTAAYQWLTHSMAFTGQQSNTATPQTVNFSANYFAISTTGGTYTVLSTSRLNITVQAARNS